MTFGIFKNVIREHLHPGKEAQFCSVGVNGVLEGVKVIPDRIISYKITAYAGRTSGNDMVVAEQLEGAVATETQICPEDFLVKRIALFEFRNGIVVRILF